MFIQEAPKIPTPLGETWRKASKLPTRLHCLFLGIFQNSPLYNLHIPLNLDLIGKLLF